MNTRNLGRKSGWPLIPPLDGHYGIGADSATHFLPGQRLDIGRTNGLPRTRASGAREQLNEPLR